MLTLGVGSFPRRAVGKTRRADDGGGEIVHQMSISREVGVGIAVHDGAVRKMRSDVLVGSVRVRGADTLDHFGESFARGDGLHFGEFGAAFVAFHVRFHFVHFGEHEVEALLQVGGGGVDGGGLFVDVFWSLDLGWRL